MYLGVFNSPESRREYGRLVAELASSPAPQVVAAGTARGLTVDEVLVPFMRWALTHYRTAAGTHTSEVDELKRSLAPLRRLYGHTAAADFGPRALAAVRQEMVSAGWCRTNINRRIDRVKRVFRWASAEELVPVTVYTALRTLAGLQRGRTAVRESAPVGPVEPAHVAAALPFLSRHVRALVELQRLTGMRPGEVRAFNFAEVDRSAEPWLYQPAHHKTRHRGKVRVIPLGPRARALLVAFLVNDRPPPSGWEGLDLANDPTGRLAAADAFQEAGRDRDADLLRDLARPVAFVAGCVVDPAAAVFSPAAERAERSAVLRAGRKSKVPPSQRARRKAAPERRPGTAYCAPAYAAAIHRACEAAGVPHWHPNQLRHSFATEVRRAHGLEAAQVLLGHSQANVTQVYAERDLTLAVRVANEVG
ncbi:tyrosine-type recombinase/integrase [Gemmata sp.]|uniref:tyrosine-type recombinase/integrase n=1 Tax=Gemmata sp. TaxID=1914242 RepID=UPI003F6E465A